MQFNIELLPAPLGPIIALISCSSTENDASVIADFINSNNKAKRFGVGHNVLTFTLPEKDMNGNTINYGDIPTMLNASLYDKNPDVHDDAVNLNWDDIGLVGSIGSFATFSPTTGYPESSFIIYNGDNNWLDLGSFKLENRVSYYIFTTFDLNEVEAWFKWTVDINDVTIGGSS